MEFSELLIQRRSIREYEDKAVPTKLVEEIINESLYAPSGGNRQPWGFIVVNDRDTIKRLSDSSKQTILDEIEANPKHFMAIYKEGLTNKDNNVFYNAPCVVYILSPKDPTSRADAAILATYFMLSAAAKGLGTCWIGLGTKPGPDLKAEIGLTDDLGITAPLCLGYPKAIPDVPERRPANILKTIG